MALSKGGKIDPSSGKQKKKGPRRVFKNSQMRAFFNENSKLRVSGLALEACTLGTEFFLQELFNQLHTSSINRKKKRIYPQDINAALNFDDELKKLSRKWYIRNAGKKRVSEDDPRDPSSKVEKKKKRKEKAVEAEAS